MNTGLDPEVLTLDGAGKVVPASYFLPAPKKNPQGRLNHLSFDNAAVEMRPDATSRPSKLVGRLSSLLRSAMTAMGTARHRGLIPRDSRLSLVPAAPLADYDRGLESVGAFGCSPSLTLNDDYSTRETTPFCGASDTEMRSAGFHTHQELLDGAATQAAVAVLDGLLGLTDVIMTSKMGFKAQARVRRMELGYGRAGEFRTREINGVTVLEYRVLSPWPLLHPRITRWVIGVTREVARQDLTTLLTILDSFPKRQGIATAINDMNVSAALNLRMTCISSWHRSLGGSNAIRPQRIMEPVSQRRWFSKQW